MCHYLVLLPTDGAQVGFVAAAADVAQLFGRLGRHGLGETQTAPGVSGRPDLGDDRLPLHGWRDARQEAVDNSLWTFEPLLV